MVSTNVINKHHEQMADGDLHILINHPEEELPYINLLLNVFFFVLKYKFFKKLQHGWLVSTEAWALCVNTG